MTQIIALAGPKANGKSTLSTLLGTKKGYTNVPFATPIKLMLEAFLRYEGVPYDRINEMLFGEQKEIPTALLGGKSPRFAMQTLGSEWRDLLDRHLWLNAWGEQIRHMPKVVVDDLRFKHEAERVRTLGGKVFLIHREQALVSDSHISEQEWKSIPYDGVVNNDTTPEEAFAQLEALL